MLFIEAIYYWWALDAVSADAPGIYADAAWEQMARLFHYAG